MKSVLSTAAFILLFIPAVYAQNWVEERAFFSKSEATPRIDGLFTKGFGKKVDGFVWFQVAQNYSQAYGGILYTPKQWIQIAAGAGLEQAGNPGRIGGYIWVGKKRSSLLLIGEYGGSGLWGKLEYNYKINNMVGLGAISERFKGTGPRIQISIPHTPMTIWGSAMIYKSAPTALLGIRVGF